jgi:hypothetical protein
MSFSPFLGLGLKAIYTATVIWKIKCETYIGKLINRIFRFIHSNREFLIINHVRYFVRTILLSVALIRYFHFQKNIDSLLQVLLSEDARIKIDKFSFAYIR